MTSDEKIKWVRNRVSEQEKFTGLGFASYPLVPVEQELGGELDDLFAIFGGSQPKSITPKTTVVVMTVEEQMEILKRMEKEKLIKIMEVRKTEALLEIFPLHPSPIKLKTLEHIARALADTFTGAQILDTLIDYGIPRCDIPYPDTKWRTLQNMFLSLATSPNPEQREKFGGAITVFLHPLNFNADESASQNLIADFNKYLKYDGFEVVAADDGDGYKLSSTKEKTKVAPPVKPLTEEEERAERIARNTPRTSPPPLEMPDFDLPKTDADLEQEYSEQVEYETGILRNPKAAENLAVIREAYKTLMAIVSSFCVDPTTPSRELNTAYAELSKVVSKELNDFCGDFSEFEVFSFDKYKKNGFGVPFTNLYAAELEFKEKKRQMHWDEIRPEMNAVLGQIEELCEAANSPEVISEPQIQKVIGGAMLLLSETAAKRKGANAASTEQTIKMEITKMPELHVRGAEDGTIVKGKKRLHLPKFKATDWGKIVIRFIDERTVIIVADKKDTLSADYESLGFSDDKRGKPNSAWGLLYTLAENGGETKPLGTPIPDNVKQHKKQLSDRLKTIFKNDTDPFYDPTDTHTYKIKINLVPPQANGAKADTLGVEEYLKDTMTEEYER